MPRRAPGRSVQELEALLAERDARLGELGRALAERDRELADRDRRQAATAEVLRAINTSVGVAGQHPDRALQQVLDALVGSVGRLCDGETAGIQQLVGGELRVLAWYARDAEAEARRVARMERAGRRGKPTPLTRGTVSGRAVIERRTVAVPDLAAAWDEFPDSRPSQEIRGTRSHAVTPLLRGNQPIGLIAVSRYEVRPFTGPEITLLESFADQAVIAIENARLFQELQESNAGLREALAQQTATSEVLQVISRSPADLPAVLDAIVRNAATLLHAENAVLFRERDGLHRLAADHGLTAEERRPLEENPITPGRGSATARALQARRTVHVHDAAADPEYTHPATATHGGRTMLAVPLLRDGEPLGAIALRRNEVRAFGGAEIALLETFADQAVIAIENARLFQELQDRLEEQTATADVLRIISGSPTDPDPVFAALAESAVRLLRGRAGMVVRLEDGRLRACAIGPGSPPEWLGMPLELRRDSLLARSILERRIVHLAGSLEEFEAEYAPMVAVMRAAGYARLTAVAVPLLHGDTPMGAIVVNRDDGVPFSDQQVALVQTFADQAVIAIENARLFSELQQRTEELTRSVQRLTALFEVGQAVGGMLDLDRLLEIVVARASDLAGADGGAVYEYNPAADAFELRAAYRMPEEMVAAVRERPIRLGETVVGRPAAERAPVQYADVLAEEADDRTRDALERAGYRAVLAVPLLRESAVIGTLVVRRRTPGAFDPDTVALLQTFATQSALAIQNARLFQELADKSRQLEEASRHKSEFLANMSHELRTPLNAVIGFTEVLLERYFGELNAKQEDYLQDVLSSGQHLLALINDILDLSKVEAGRMELELGTFDLGPVLEAGLVMVRERATRQGVELRLAVDPDLGRVEADERKVKQVVFNLLSNAVKFTPVGGRVDVRAWRADGQVHVAVADTGVGIAPEDQARIFEEFQQARGRAPGNVEGTGLGLALARCFVELHGGWIRVESAVGEGSTFTFALPVGARWPAS